MGIKNREVNWLDLPDDVLGLITDRFFVLKDYIRFGAVCRSWRSVYAHNLCRHCVPVLMSPPPPPPPPYVAKDPAWNWNQIRSVYSISEGAPIYDLQLPVPHDRYCRGSSHGWLVTLHHNLTDIRLLNPYTGTEIELPPATALPHTEREIYNELFISKAVLSASPSTNPNYVVMAIYGQYCRLALFKAGDTTWTPLDLKFSVMDDVIYWRDQFYVVDTFGLIFVCDPHLPCPKPVKVDLPPPPQVSCGRKYLVVSDGELWLVERTVEDEPYETCDFDVYKLKTSTSTWSSGLQNLGGRALFLGNNSSMSLLASEFVGCESDCIYFTDDAFFRNDDFHQRHPGPYDVGVFNMVEGTIQQYIYPLKTNGLANPVPIWIEPPIQRSCKDFNLANRTIPQQHFQLRPKEVSPNPTSIEPPPPTVSSFSLLRLFVMILLCFFLLLQFI